MCRAHIQAGQATPLPGVSTGVCVTNQDALVHVAVVHSQADTDDATVVDLLVVEGQRE